MAKIHPNGLIFSFTPITIKPQIVKEHMKVTFLFYKFLGKIHFRYANELNTRPN